jgi:hypothetical protein
VGDGEVDLGEDFGREGEDGCLVLLVDGGVEVGSREEFGWEFEAWAQFSLEVGVFGFAVKTFSWTGCV